MMNIKGERTKSDTPCIGICSTTNLGDNVCVGCGRTAEEVINWNSYSDYRKATINERIKDVGTYSKARL